MKTRGIPIPKDVSWNGASVLYSGTEGKGAWAPAPRLNVGGGG